MPPYASAATCRRGRGATPAAGRGAWLRRRRTAAATLAPSGQRGPSRTTSTVKESQCLKRDFHEDPTVLDSTVSPFLDCHEDPTRRPASTTSPKREVPLSGALRQGVPACLPACLLAFKFLPQSLSPSSIATLLHHTESLRISSRKPLEPEPAPPFLGFPLRVQ